MEPTGGIEEAFQQSLRQRIGPEAPHRSARTSQLVKAFKVHTSHFMRERGYCHQTPRAPREIVPRRMKMFQSVTCATLRDIV